MQSAAPFTFALRIVAVVFFNFLIFNLFYSPFKKKKEWGLSNWQAHADSRFQTLNTPIPTECCSISNN